MTSAKNSRVESQGPTLDALGAAAYQAYFASAGMLNPPAWEAWPEGVRAAWRAAAKAVLQSAP
jgi:hypothetical protein